MKVFAKGKAAFTSSASASSVSALHPVDLVDRQRHRLALRHLGRASRSMIASTPSVSPRCASISSTITSASAAPPQAALTIARSSRRRGRKRPGVSTKTICACALHRDAADAGPRRLHLVGDDRDLRPHHPVQKRRLPGVRLADQGDEARACVSASVIRRLHPGPAAPSRGRLFRHAASIRPAASAVSPDSPAAPRR